MSQLPEVSGLRLLDVAAFLVVTGMAMSLALLAARALLFRLRVASRHPLVDGEWLRDRDDLGGESVRLSVLDGGGVESPFSFAREICIPGWMIGDLTATERASVLAHELEHIKRRDRWWALLIDLLCALLFLQPLLFLIRRQSIAAAEERADRAAVVHVGSAVPLAEVLYKVTSRMMSHDAVPALAFLRKRSALVRRVERLLSGKGTNALPSPAVFALLAAGMAAAFLPSLAFSEDLDLALPAFERGMAAIAEPAREPEMPPPPPRERVRRSAPPNAADALMSLLETDPSAHVRYAAAEALGRRGESRAAAALRRAARSDASANVRAAATSALEGIRR
jgi:hypothetical protein